MAGPRRRSSTEANEKQLLAASRSLRFAHMNLLIDGDAFDLSRYPYLIDIIDKMGRDQRVIVRKGGQLGYTAAMVLCAIDLAKNLYHRGILYLFPTQDDVTDFSRARFARMLSENPILQASVGEADSVGLRKIGRTFCYFRGARSRSRLKSIPVDLLIEDEADEMEPRQRALAEKRLDGSQYKHRVTFSTPTIPDYGVDIEYKNSTQNQWLIRCEGCGAFTCMEDEWPECLQRQKDGSVIRVCKKCSKEIHPIDGQWVERAPGKEWVGYYVSQLNSPSVDPRQILEEYEDPMVDKAEFYNHRLGLAYADIEDILTKEMLDQVCGVYPRAFSAQGPCILGADVGKEWIHYIIAEKRTDTFLKVHDYGIVPGFEELHDRAARFNVMMGVIDEMAETRKVREFAASHPWVYGCWYSEEQRTKYDWKHNERRVSANRTEILDQSHKLIVQRMCTFPRPDEEAWPDFCKQMTNLARKRYKDLDETGRSKVRWIVRGGRKYDHFRHAWAYVVLASESAPVARAVRRIQTRDDIEDGTSWMAM